MELALRLKNSQELTTQDKAAIDEFILNAIEVHKGNSAAINKLVMDSVTALTISEARSDELKNQGFLKRLWNGFTGKNQKIRADIDRNLAKAQYASQQMIQKLAEQNLLTFDTITAVNNKLNTLIIEVEEEINNIYRALLAFFKQTRSDLIQMEDRISKLERNVDLLHWNSTIEYRMYDDQDYCQLSDVEKIVCVTNDFYHLTKGQWNTADIMLLKSTLTEIGLAVKGDISSKEFYDYLIGKPELINRLFKDITLDGLVNIEEYQAPLIKGIEKLTKLQCEEKYLLDTVITHLEQANVNYKQRDIQLSMIHHYLANTAYMRTDVKVNIFDFVVELLSNLSMINSSIQEITIPEIASAEESKEIKEPLFDESSKNDRGNTNGNIINGGYVAQQGDWIFYRNTSDKNKLYKVKTDGSEKTKICDDNIKYINVIGEWIYYCNETNGMNIYKIKLNGKDRTRLNSAPSETVHVLGDTIYYFDIDEKKIYSMDTSGNNIKKIIDRKNIYSKTFNVEKDIIYFMYQQDIDCYPSVERIMKYDLLKNCTYQLYEFSQGLINMMVEENSKFYFQDSFEIYINNNRAIYEDIFTNCINVSYGDIFYGYITGKCINKLINNKKIEIAKVGFTVQTINVLEDWLYFEDEIGIVNRIKKDGAEMEKVT
ncbi:MAG: DUF5050 domain-containing protein [Desulfitobacteriia bacterium]|jgi:hypothetical protein